MTGFSRGDRVRYVGSSAALLDKIGRIEIINHSINAIRVRFDRMDCAIYCYPHSLIPLLEKSPNG